MRINKLARCLDQYERNLHIPWERKLNGVSKGKGTSVGLFDLVTMAAYFLITQFHKE